MASEEIGKLPEWVNQKQKAFQSVHKLTHLKAPGDRLTSVIIPGLLIATGLTLMGRGVYHMATGQGEGVTRFREGQRVVPLTMLEVSWGNESWQEYVCLAEHLVLPISDKIPDEAAVQFVINPFTAVSMLRILQVLAGEYVLQSAAGFVLGRQVINLVRQLGVENDQHSAQVRTERGIEGVGVICSSGADIVGRMQHITAAKDVWGAVDAVIGTMTQSLASSVREGDTVTVNVSDLFRGVTIQAWVISRSRPESLHACAAQVEELLTDGLISTADCENFKRFFSITNHPSHPRLSVVDNPP